MLLLKAEDCLSGVFIEHGCIVVRCQISLGHKRVLDKVCCGTFIPELNEAQASLLPALTGDFCKTPFAISNNSSNERRMRYQLSSV